MFKDNKYTHIYYKIINSAKTRVTNDYVERHHIIPQSMGGDNSKQNLVKLTAREHYLVHLLLTKMTEGDDRRKMAYALSFFNTACRNHGRLRPSARWYEYSRKLLAETRRGKPASPQCLAVVSKVLKGKPLSQAHRDKLRAALVHKTPIWFCRPNSYNQMQYSSDLKQLCLDEDLSFHTISKRLKDGLYVITSGKRKGWAFSLNLIPGCLASTISNMIMNASQNRSRGIKAQWENGRK